MNTIIKLSNVNYEYTISDEEDLNEDINVALKNINLEIYEGEFLCIVGKNGSGKSTLAKMLNALLLPKSGDVVVYGNNTKDENKLLEIRKNVGMVFQNPDNQIVASLVEEDVAFGLENLGIETTEMRNRVDDVLNRFKLIDYKNKSPNKLSGGQKQRLALAGILAMKSKVIVLDEPTAMLDPKGRQEVMNCLLELKQNENITIVLVTHYMEEILKADRVVIMDNSEIKSIKRPIEVFNDSKIEEYGIELPTIIKIKNKLIDRGIAIDNEAVTAKDIANCI